MLTRIFLVGIIQALLWFLMDIVGATTIKVELQGQKGKHG